MVLKYKIEFDINKINKKKDDKLERIKPLFTQEILKDINYFAPKLSGNLIGSSFLSSNFKKGRIIYNTKYAKYLHYSSRVRKINTRYNKNAKKQWVTYAYTKNKQIWMQKLKKLWKLV